jgi:hypothetical protein
MEFCLIKEGVPFSEIEQCSNRKIARWFSILSEVNKINDERVRIQTRT